MYQHKKITILIITKTMMLKDTEIIRKITILIIIILIILQEYQYYY